MKKNKNSVSEEDCYERMTALMERTNGKITRIIYFQLATLITVISTLVMLIFK